MLMTGLMGTRPRPLVPRQNLQPGWPGNPRPENTSIRSAHANNVPFSAALQASHTRRHAEPVGDQHSHRAVSRTHRRFQRGRSAMRTATMAAPIAPGTTRRAHSHPPPPSPNVACEYTRNGRHCPGPPHSRRNWARREPSSQQADDTRSRRPAERASRWHIEISGVAVAVASPAGRRADTTACHTSGRAQRSRSDACILLNHPG